MSGNLHEILPDPLSEESERILEELVKRKMKSAAGLAVRLLHAMEEHFGPEAREVMQEMVHDRHPSPRQDVGEPEEDLREFCDNLDKACVGSHQWERIIDEPGRIGYHYTRCLWAEIYRELGEPNLGFFYCAGDEPSVKASNPKLVFTRTQVLMKGDDLCDHVFSVEQEPEGIE
jgi:hypothetical protein